MCDKGNTGEHDRNQAGDESKQRNTQYRDHECPNTDSIPTARCCFLRAVVLRIEIRLRRQRDGGLEFVACDRKRLLCTFFRRNRATRTLIRTTPFAVPAGSVMHFATDVANGNGYPWGDFDRTTGTKRTCLALPSQYRFWLLFRQRRFRQPIVVDLGYNSPTSKNTTSSTEYTAESTMAVRPMITKSGPHFASFSRRGSR